MIFEPYDGCVFGRIKLISKVPQKFSLRLNGLTFLVGKTTSATSIIQTDFMLFAKYVNYSIEVEDDEPITIEYEIWQLSEEAKQLARKSRIISPEIEVTLRGGSSIFNEW